MQFRTNIWPKTFGDAIVTGFLFVIIPAVYWYELFIVLPTFYKVWSGWYTFHFISGTFILFNITANYAAVMFCDTSIKGRILPTTMEPHWTFCTVCESVAPPRSFHCNTCKTCILKRDHHCMFSSCCIGHFNLRYFVVFVFYTFLATVYATYYNVFFIYGFVELRNWMSLFRLVFPLAFVVIDFSIAQCFLFLTFIIVLGSVFTGTLLCFHLSNIIKGCVTHENKTNNTMYDLGRKRNIQDAFGDKWYLIWLGPFVQSKLPSDGIKWNLNLSRKAK